MKVLPAEKRIKILIADDYQVVRHGLSVLMRTENDFEIVAFAKDGQEAIDLCEARDPDVLLIDIKMPRVDGIQAMREIHERFPHIRMIALTSYQEDELIQSALKAGAVGYLMKDGSIDSVIQAVRKAYDGKHALSEEAVKMLVDLSIKQKENNSDRGDYNLSEREIEVLECIVEGMTNNQIADKLVVSRSTVKFHVSSILNKLNVSSRTEASTMAIREGLIKAF